MGGQHLPGHIPALKHADLVVQGKYSIEEVRESQPSPAQAQNDDAQQIADEAILRVPRLNHLYIALERTLDGQPIIKLSDLNA